MLRSTFLVLSLLISHLTYAHFPMLITESPFVEQSEPVHFVFAVGHPYEQDHSNAERPAAVNAVNPRGGKTDLLTNLQKELVVKLGDEVAVWNLSFTPQQKGSHIIALDTKPSISRNGENLYQEYIKTVLYAERGSGWDQRSGQPVEIIPLTRPFGLKKDFVFRGQLMAKEKPLANQIIYIEHFEETPPNQEEIPVEPLVTFEVKTDQNGYFMTTLPESGWWIIASYVDDIGTIQHDGATYQHNAMAGIWINVEESE